MKLYEGTSGTTEKVFVVPDEINRPSSEGSMATPAVARNNGGHFSGSAVSSICFLDAPSGDRLFAACRKGGAEL